MRYYLLQQMMLSRWQDSGRAVPPHRRRRTKMLNNYHYFIVLAEELNISRAASRLYISHQCLSKYLKNLEQEHHVTFLWRKPIRSGGFSIWTCWMATELPFLVLDSVFRLAAVCSAARTLKFVDEAARTRSRSCAARISLKRVLKMNGGTLDD